MWAYQFYTSKFDVESLIKDHQMWCQIFQNDTYDDSRMKEMSDEKMRKNNQIVETVWETLV